MRGQGRCRHKRTIPINMHGGLLHQTHVAVDAPTEHMFAAARHVAPPQIVYPYGNVVLSLLHVWREAHVKPGVAPFVRAGQTTVHIDFRHLEHAIEFQKYFPFQIFLIQHHGPTIPTVTGIEILPHEIRYAERMR